MHRGKFFIRTFSGHCLLHSRLIRPSLDLCRKDQFYPVLELCDSECVRAASVHTDGQYIIRYCVDADPTFCPVNVHKAKVL